MALHPAIGNGTGSGNTQVNLQAGSQAKLVSLVDPSGNIPNYLPFGAVYNYTIIDTPGVVATNNFLSVFNPTTSLKTLALLSLAIESYSIGSSGTANSMAGYRTSAASGGTLDTVITKYDTREPTSQVEVRVDNPTVTLTTGLPVAPVGPPLSNGAGGAVTAAFTPASSAALAVAHPGEGIVFRTLAGNTNQMWNITVTWLEF